MAPRQEIVESVLGPYHDVIYGVVDAAWQDWLSSSEFPRARSSRTRACIVWDRMIDHANAAFLENPRVRCVEHYNTWSFIVDDLVLFRFKKGNQVGYTANYPTQTALAFHDHERQYNLFGFEDYHRVQIVYTLDELESDLGRVLVVARDNSRIAWDYQIQPSTIRAEEIPSLPTPASERPRIVLPRSDERISRTQE